MKKLILLSSLLLTTSVFANETSKHWIYGGVDVGMGNQSSDDSNEKDSKGTYLGGKILYQYRFDKVDLEGGVGWMNYRADTKIKSGTYEKLRLHTEAPYLHTGAYYKLTERFSLGLSFNYIMDGGLLISMKDESNMFAGIGAYYRLPVSEKVDMRVGAQFQKSVDFIDRNVNLYGLSLQIGFPLSQAEKASQARKAPPVMAQRVMPRKEVTLVTLDETLINFETASYDLDARSKALLADLGAFLASNTDIWESLEIHGHTDIRGGAYYNQALSVKRAHSVYQELLTLSLPKDRLSFDGQGYEKPLAQGISAEAFAQNRRVDLRFINVSNKIYFNAFINKLKVKYQRVK